ncbi:hypothetical protein UNDKW_3558 [Undibacterium sp. KW1]|uniref:hypothetical protein n=1 Tax=Undibacterium sp. KW1 TaxID=2058624 RepID=UPI001331F590|nr:hypothetical protein [Undibacterium sp. KW1]BBB61831.1 hypothetical protein UNDKW_3558 [Undibacterium sp. KW1]
MNVFGSKTGVIIQKSGLWIGIIILIVIAASLTLSLFTLCLANILFFTQKVADNLGYTFLISDEIAKAILTLGGAICVGFLALYGVRQQNLSAEMRHRKDASLTLKKEIFLEVAEASFFQFKILTTYAAPSVTEEDRQVMMQEVESAFFRMQIVSSQETIEAMLDSNHAWTRARYAIAMLPPVENSNEARIIRLQEIQAHARPFMRTLWQFNISARKEIDCGLPNESTYLAMMNNQFDKVDIFFKELQKNMKISR